MNLTDQALSRFSACFDAVPSRHLAFAADLAKAISLVCQMKGVAYEDAAVIVGCIAKSMAVSKENYQEAQDVMARN